MKPFYITTTLPYVNAAPHIGFALEIVQADVIARAKRCEGFDVIFNTGTDEHGAKIYEKAREAGMEPQKYVDEYAAKFAVLKSALNLSYTNFIRTTDLNHIKAAQEFWKICAANGDIYKKFYSIKYCVGCELEKTDSELLSGRCPIHPNRELEIREEENYFFRFSAYQDKLLALYREHPDLVVPTSRFNEVRTFMESGLQDFSISRLASKMPWGIPVPGDESQVFYVWFDALINYISTIGWPEDETNFKTYWPGIQFAGKDNLRQQAAMWQAMLLSAGLPPSRQIIIHGFITCNGEKMSKSLGNVVDPVEIASEYGTDPLRYWLLREMNPFEDGDFTIEKFKARYTGDLANGLGNFVSRVQALAEKYGPFEVDAVLSKDIEENIEKTRTSFSSALKEYRFHEALATIFDLVKAGDIYVNSEKPWETGDKNKIFNLIAIMDNVGAMLEPFLPDTAQKITDSINNNSGRISVKKSPPLFPQNSDLIGIIMRPTYFDAHTHVHFAAFAADYREVISRALKHGIGMITVGTQKNTSERGIEVAHEFENDPVYAAVGLHPIHTESSYHDADELGDTEEARGFTSRGEKFDFELYRKLAGDPKVVSIGECGLDYYRLGGESKTRQAEAFIGQIEVAKAVVKPLMIHCREAFPDLIKILKEHRNKLNDKPGALHFFTGTQEEASTLLSLGFSFTFGGVVTFTRNYNEVIKLIPIDRIMSETDAPYVAPAPYRGKRNEPLYIVETVKKLAELKGVTIEEMKKQIFENVTGLFRINPE